MIDLRKHGGIYGGFIANIKSIQKLSLDFTPMAASSTYIIAPVDIDKSVILVSQNYFNTSPADQCAMVRFIDSSTIELSRHNGSNNNGWTIEVTIIEFNGVKSKQTGTVVVPTGSSVEPFPISTVNLNKSLIFGSHKNNYTIQVTALELRKAFKFLDSDQIGISRGTAGTTTAHYQVIEFI